MIRFIAPLVVVFFIGNLSLYAATDNQTLDAQTREYVHKATFDYIGANTVGDIYSVYDVVTNEVVQLRFKKLHAGIRTTEDFFTSCANFENEEGTHYDIDFLLIKNEQGNFTVTQPYVHGVGKQQRPFHP